MALRGFEPVIGLEIHAQLKTQSKIFSADSTQFDALDNANTSAVCMGFPGTLPVINRKVIEFAALAGWALGCRVNQKSIFARKNYFYPDLPKGYQISQYAEPICEEGAVDLDEPGRRIPVVRAHLEEDAGKSLHLGDRSLMNYNRAGVPLLEIVSAPEIRSAAEAAHYARKVRWILRYLDLCEGNLEEGSLRCDCNVSVRPVGETRLGTRVELKNINSFRFIEKAIDFEIERQVDCLERGEAIVQETRLYDPDKNRTVVMRTKEDAQDYRYFPDPDLLPMRLDSAWLQNLKASMPEFPQDRRRRFLTEYGLPESDANLLTEERSWSDFFEQVVRAGAQPKMAANWILTDVLATLNEQKKDLRDCSLRPEHLGDLLRRVAQGALSGKMAKMVLADLWSGLESPEQIIQKKGLSQVSDEGTLQTEIEKIVRAHPSQVQEYLAGKEKVFGFFVGAVMKVTRGQANPEVVNRLLKAALESMKGSP